MKHITVIFLFSLVIPALLLTACSVSNSEVGIDGRILHMNQAEFYVYSTDGVIDGIDTIFVQGGRFDYLSEINKDGTLVVVFPNFSQLPLFVEGGMSISINGDASNVKDLEVSGGGDNKLFSEWRKANADGSFDKQKASARKFIEDNPDSPVSLWLIRYYYVTSQMPDISGAVSLLNEIMKASPENLEAKKLHTQLTESGGASVNDRIGHFSTTDINGKKVNESMLQNGTTVILTVASWNFESQSMLRILAGRLRKKNSDNKSGLSVDRVIVLSLDADVNECRRTVKSCNADNVTMICDGQQFDSPLLTSLHLTTIPYNIVVKDGKVSKVDVPSGSL